MLNGYQITNRKDAFRDALALQEPNFVLLKLWKIPSFEPPVGWNIFYKHPIFAQRRKDPRSIPYVQKTYFQSRSQNLQYFLTAVRYQEAPLLRDNLNDFLTNISQLAIPPIIEKFGSGADGTSFGFEIPGYGFGSFCIDWWHDGPDEWRPVTTWYHKLVEFLEVAIASNTVEEG
jgi:hypothetical protein